VVLAVGHGLKARTARTISSAGRVQSITPLLLSQRPAERGQAGILGLRRELASQPAGQGLDQQSSPLLRQPFCQRVAGIVRLNGQRSLRQDRPGVHARIHAHDGAAGHLVAGQDGGLHRRCAPPAGQQRGVNVDAAMRGQLQHGRPQDLSIGGHHDQIRLHLRQLGHDIGGLERRWLEHWQALGRGKGLDGRWLQPAAATGRPIGLGHHRDQLVAAVQQCGQAGHRKLGSAHENHTRHSNNLCAAILAQGRVDG
jgi:hypothetical protein